MRSTHFITTAPRILLLAVTSAAAANGDIAGPPDHVPPVIRALDEFDWPTAQAEKPPDTTQDDDNERGGATYDFEQSHRRILENLQETATWLDSFFGSQRIDETPSTELRIAWENNFLESEAPNTRLKMRGKLRLPRMQERLQLVFEGEPDEKDPSGLEQENASSALRYNITRNALKSIDFDLGFRGGLSDPRLFTRLRMQKRLLHSERQLHRLTPAVTWDSRLGWTLYVRHDSEFKPRDKLFFRATTQPGWSQDERGYTLEQNFTIFRAISSHRYIALDWLNGGVVHPYSDIVSRVRVRHRRALRENRLYLEFAPGLRFAEENGYRMQWEGYVSLEVVFSPDRK